MDEADRCPFCGGEAHFYMEMYTTRQYYVMCTDCHASSGSYDTQEEAAAAWNRRTDEGWDGK